MKRWILDTIAFPIGGSFTLIFLAGGILALVISPESGGDVIRGVGLLVASFFIGIVTYFCIQWEIS